VKEIQQHESEQLLEELREAIVPDKFSCTQHLGQYHGELQARLTNKKLPIFSIADLAHDKVYQKWRQSKQSHTIILRGGTRQTRSPLSWLSPAAVELVQKLRVEEGENAAIAYHFCKREDMAEDDHMHTVVARITYQLLEQRASILHSRQTYEGCLGKLKSNKWRDKEMTTACDLFVDTLNHFELVYLILDRPEECRAGESGLAKLLQAAQRTKCVQKVFIVVDKDRTKEGVDDWTDIGTVDVIDNLDQ